MTQEDAINREKLRDELHAIQHTNINQLPGETYEDNVARRAGLSVRADEILRELYSF